MTESGTRDSGLGTSSGVRTPIPSPQPLTPSPVDQRRLALGACAVSKSLSPDALIGLARIMSRVTAGDRLVIQFEARQGASRPDSARPFDTPARWCHPRLVVNRSPRPALPRWITLCRVVTRRGQRCHIESPRQCRCPPLSWSRGIQRQVGPQPTQPVLHSVSHRTSGLVVVNYLTTSQRCRSHWQQLQFCTIHHKQG
jgi:hypothetical protein